MRAYRVCGDKMDWGIGSSPYPKYKEFLRDVYATTSLKTAQAIIDYLDEKCFSYDGGFSWAKIFIIDAHEIKKAPDTGSIKLRPELDKGEVIVSGEVIDVYIPHVAEDIRQRYEEWRNRWKGGKI